MTEQAQSTKLEQELKIGMPKIKPVGDLRFGNICLFEPVDVAIWGFVFLFFTISSLVSGGNLSNTFLGAAGIVVIMFFVGVTIEVIIETLKNIKGLGTIVGFITNGPEALCLIVGIIAQDILFAASTPLGSNIMNPVMLIFAALVTGMVARTIRTYPKYTVICVGLTATFAISFFFIPQKYFLVWWLIMLPLSFVLFFKRPPEPAADEEDDPDSLAKIWFLPAAAVLVIAGYLLDPVVSFTAEHSHAPKGAIGFFVLSALTSWPEFKSCLSLFRRNKPLAAVLNITVSNITNIWLAMTGIILYLIFY
jgi:cation:H+ antiporter